MKKNTYKLKFFKTYEKIRIIKKKNNRNIRNDTNVK